MCKSVVGFALLCLSADFVVSVVVPRRRPTRAPLSYANDDELLDEEGNSYVRRNYHREANITENRILDVLMENYDKRVRPPPNNATVVGGLNPVLVKVNILIRMLSKIDVVNMEYSMQITFRERWQDKRLAFDHLNLPNPPKFLTVPHAKSGIWLPDTFFPTEKAAHRHMIDTENMFLRIYGNGTILYSARLSLTCSCPMHLQLYPLDVQHCDFDLISYAHTTRDIYYEWDVEPIQLKPGVGEDLPNFLLEKENIDTGIECFSQTNTGIYACLRMRMPLSRLMTYFILQLYFPTTMIVVVSWVSFWIDMHSTAGRVALAMTTLLTITTMQSSINAKLPPVNYVKVIDVWLGTCQAFVFGALIEYAIVCYRDNKMRAESGIRNAAFVRKSQAARARYKNPTAGALAPTMRQLMSVNTTKADNDAKNYQTQFDSDDDAIGMNKKEPCTCGLSGIGSAMLAGFGLLDPLLTTLIPMSIENNRGKNNYDQIDSNNNVTNDDHDRHNAGTPNNEWNTTNSLYQNQQQNRAGVYKIINTSFKTRSFPLTVMGLFGQFIRRKLKKPEYLPARIDYYARILMPLGFLVFNAFYWGICLYMSARQKP